VSIGATSGLFSGEQERRGGTVRPLAIAAVGALFALVIGVAFLSQGSAEEPAAAAVATAPEAASLELTALSHAAKGNEWTIAGTVHNPADAGELTNVVAIAFVFDEAGAFLGSGRAPLELIRLGAGEASPFRVIVPATGPVARYRIGFRGDDGRVIRHFDRRPIASEQARP
jgi:hypothetical protein